jgi:hypothetical protein
MNDYIEARHYSLNSIKMPIGYAFFPIANAEFIKSYEHNGKTSFVFRYNIKHADFYEWNKCWTHIAKNHIITKKTENILIESHIYSFLIEEIIIEPTKSIYEHGSIGIPRIDLYPFKLEREEHCGGGTMSYCQRTESDQWPKYIDEKGNKRCCACECRGPMIDNSILILDI